MTGLSDPLQALIDAEERIVGPTPDAAERCWQQIRGDVQRGVLPDLDVPPPVRAARWSGAAWLALVVLGGGALVTGVVAASGSASHETDPPSVVPAVAPARPPPDRGTTALGEAPIPRPAPAPVPALVTPEVADPPDEIPVEHAVRARGAATPRRRPPTPSPAPAGDADSFAAELRLIAQGQAAITREDFAEALQIAEVYRKTYPEGHFQEDGEALRALALCASAASSGADAARRFLRAHPRSIHATRVREVCELDPS